ncbi:MAG: HNH endonuclease signature motif containing protein [Gemmataceae bacterium]
MAKSLRERVRNRAAGRCEYCHMPEGLARYAAFRLEHIVAKQHGGKDDPENLAWSCQRCNLHKGTNLSGVDPLTDQVALLFNPRRQSWKRHFEWFGPLLAGRTRTGRATVAVLKINDPQYVEVRQAAMENDEWSED